MFILKGSPIPHVKAPANPLNTGHHPKNWSDVSMFWSSVPCIRSHKSAGQFIVNFVTGLMVGDRRFPGATILGGSFSTSSANHPVSVPPTGSEPRDGFSFNVVLGLRFTLPGTLRRRFLTRCRGSRLLRPRRCGDFGLVSRHQPAEHRLLIFPLLPTLRRRVSHAEERLRHQRFLHAGERLRNNASHTQGSGCEINASSSLSIFSAIPLTERISGDNVLRNI